MKDTISMPEIMSNPRYRGKHLILANGKLYTAATGERASEILQKIRKKDPDVVPEVAYLPKSRFLVL